MSTGVILLLALAVSIDGFSAGLSCGLRRLVIPFLSLAVICCSSAAAVAFSMFLGSAVAYLFPLEIIPYFGGVVLIFFGGYIIHQGLVNRTEEAGASSHSPARKILSMARRPEEAALDRSGALSTKEAFLLGLALAVDALGAGFGAALIGCNLPLTVLAVGLTKMILLPLGVFCGQLIAEGFSLHMAAVLGGIILIFMGIVTIL